MTPEQWKEIERLYDAAIELEPAERARFLAAARVDEETRREVESLLADGDNGSGFLERRALDVAGELVARSENQVLVGGAIGRYQIHAFIGAGGMGNVYRARDTKLGRNVALKVLPEEFAGDRERLTSSEREAKLLASLNHPNIAAIYDLEKSEGIQCLVLEFVEGQTLAERLKRGPLPIKEVFEISRQIAEALEAAHEQGIIHRDLKPGNVMITTSGNVKVLDFGIAKMLETGAGPAAPTRGDRSSAGIVLGTPAYMSPEQARGQPVDKRTDIWAFGCVLFEMLSRHAAFRGDTVSDVIVAILERDPEWEQLPKDTPFNLRRLLQRCFQKDSRRRLRDIGEARLELEESVQTPRAEPRGGQSQIRNPKSSRWLYPTGVIVLAGILAAIPIALRFGTSPPPLDVRFELPVDGQAGTPQPSPDGRYVVASVVDASGNRRLWLRALNQDQGGWISGTEEGAAPFWSPDGRWIGFLTPGRMMKVSPLGGSPQTLAAVTSFNGASWNRQGDIIFAPTNRSGLSRIKETGGPAQPLTTLDAGHTENSHRFPRFLPDGRHFLFTARCTAAENNALYIGSLDSKETQRLIHVESQVVFVQPKNGGPGALLYVREGTLFRHPFDGERFTGQPFVIAETVSHSTIGMVADFAASPDGTVLVIRPGESGRSIPTWFKRDGSASGVLAAGYYLEPRLSRDGARLAFNQPDGDHGNRDIWSIDVARGTKSRLTSHSANDLEAVWSFTGPQILFASDRLGPAMRFFIKNSSNVASEEKQIENAPAGNFDLIDWSKDGRWISLQGHEASADDDIWIVPGAPDQRAFALLKTPFRELHPRFSNDGKWIAYSSNESGRREIYVIPFREGPARPSEAIQVSYIGADHPVWSRDGSELFYFGIDFKIYSVETQQLGKSAVSPSTLLTACADTQPESVQAGYIYDVSPDGRFLILCRPSQDRFVVSVNTGPG